LGSETVSLPHVTPMVTDGPLPSLFCDDCSVYSRFLCSNSAKGAAARQTTKELAQTLVLLAVASSFSSAADSPVAQPLTSVQQIRGLTPEQAARGLPIHVRGIVTTLSGWKHSFFVKDNTGSISVNRDEPDSKIRSGGLVDIEGIADPGLFAPIIVAKHVTLIGSARLPYAPLVTFSRLQWGSLDSQWVAVRGVVRSAEIVKIWEHNFLSLLVDTGSGQVRGLVLEYSGDPHNLLLDAVIEMRGACGTAFNDRRQFVSVSLFVPSLASITVTVPGNPDPFQSPLRPLDSLLSFAIDDIPRRIKVRGTVTYQSPGQNIYIQYKGRGLLVYTASRNVLPLGSVVEAAGFAANGAYSPSLDDAVIRVVGLDAPVAPLALEPKNVILGDNFGFTVPSDGALVRLRASLVEWTESATENTLLLHNGDIVFSAVLAKNSSPAIHKCAIGSVLQITGICEAHTRRGGVPDSFRILPRSPADIVVLSEPSWWTAKHATTVLTAALALTLGVLCWVAALRSQVKRQTQLIRSQLASLAAISIETNRLAKRAQEGAVAEERNLLAHELHDTLAGAFTGISMQLQAASDLAGSNEELRTACIGRADDLASYGLRNVREFVHSLTIGSANGSSLAVEMRTLLISATAGTGTNGKFTVEGHERPLSAACSNTLLRVMQEALGNAQRYAEAKNILVTLRFEKEVLSVTISDDGKGFIMDESMDKGFGLTGMQSRISRLSGRFSLTSSPGAGTEIFVELPYG